MSRLTLLLICQIDGAECGQMSLLIANKGSTNMLWLSVASAELCQHGEGMFIRTWKALSIVTNIPCTFPPLYQKEMPVVCMCVCVCVCVTCSFSCLRVFLSFYFLNELEFFFLSLLAWNLRWPSPFSLSFTPLSHHQAHPRL